MTKARTYLHRANRPTNDPGEIREKCGTYQTQWIWIEEERKLAMKRNPELALSQRAFNGRYFIWDDPDETDPAGAIIRTFGQRADIRTFYPDETAGVILKNGKRCLNCPVLRADRVRPAAIGQEAA